MGKAGAKAEARTAKARELGKEEFLRRRQARVGDRARTRGRTKVGQEDEEDREDEVVAEGKVGEP